MADWDGFYYGDNTQMRVRINTAESVLTPANLTAQLGDGSTYKWRQQYGAFHAAVIKHGSILYVPNDDGIFRALNLSNGTTASSKNLGNKMRGTPIYTPSAVCVPCDDGYLYALDPANVAAQLWRGPVGGIGGNMRMSPVATATKVICAGDDGKVRGLNLADGTTAWTYPPASTLSGLNTAIALYNGNAYVPCLVGTVPTVVVLNADTGAFVASMGFRSGATAVTACSIGVLASGQKIMVVGDSCNTVNAWNVDAAYTLSTGEVIPAWAHLWEDRQSGPIDAAPSANGIDNLVLLGTHNWSNEMHHLDRGDLQWKKDAGTGTGISGSSIQTAACFTRPDTNPASSASVVEFNVFPHGDYRVVAWKAVDSPGGHNAAWSYPGNASGSNPQFEAASPIAIDGHVYAGTLDGWLYALGP